MLAVALATMPSAAAMPNKAESESDPPEKKPKPPSNSLEAIIHRHNKPESDFARRRRLEREAKRGGWPTFAEVETAPTFDPKVGSKQFGPARSINQRQQIPKQRHRPRGRGR